MNKYEYIGTIDFEDGYYEVVKVSSDRTYLEAGTACNAGFLSFFGIDYDEDLTLDENLASLYDHIVECRQEEADIRELLRDY